MSLGDGAFHPKEEAPAVAPLIWDLVIFKITLPQGFYASTVAVSSKRSGTGSSSQSAKYILDCNASHVLE